LDRRERGKRCSPLSERDRIRRSWTADLSPLSLSLSLSLSRSPDMLIIDLGSPRVTCDASIIARSGESVGVDLCEMVEFLSVEKSGRGDTRAFSRSELMRNCHVRANRHPFNHMCIYIYMKREKEREREREREREAYRENINIHASGDAFFLARSQ